MDESANPSFLMPIKFVDEESGLKGFAPNIISVLKSKVEELTCSWRNLTSGNGCSTN